MEQLDLLPIELEGVSQERPLILQALAVPKQKNKL